MNIGCIVITGILFVFLILDVIQTRTIIKKLDMLLMSVSSTGEKYIKPIK